VSNNDLKAIVGSYLVPILNYMRLNYNQNPDVLLIRSGIDKSSIVETNRHITKTQYLAFMKQVLEQVDAHQLSMHLANEVEITQHGLLGLLSMCVINARFVLKVVLKFYRMRGRLVTLKFIEENEKGILRVFPTSDLEHAEQFTLELTLLVILKAKKQLLGEVTKEDKLSFTSKKPDNCEVGEEFIGAQFLYDQPYNQIEFPISLLNRKLKSAHQPTYELLNKQCENELSTLGNEDDLVTKIKNFLHDCNSEFPSLDQVANQLASSSRTLSRHLKKQGVSYQQLLNDERIARAKELLKYTDLTVTEISTYLYFSDASHLSKIFKRHVGKTPTEYR